MVGFSFRVRLIFEFSGTACVVPFALSFRTSGPVIVGSVEEGGVSPPVVQPATRAAASTSPAMNQSFG